MTTVSVVMATYQGGRFLPEQLRSLSAQSRLPDEVVVCDDGSTDDTLDQVRDFAAGAPFPVHLHQNPRRVGVAANFSRAISLASGSVVALSDQDDVWMPDKLARQLSILEARPAVGAVFGDATLVDAGLRPLGTGLFDSIRFSPARQRRLEHGQATEVILAWPVVCGATLAFRSSFRKLLLPIPGSGLHDVWLSVLLSAVADMAVVREPLIQYRQHGANQIGAGEKSLRQKLAQRRARGVFGDEVAHFRALAARLEGSLPTGASRRSLVLLQRKVAHLELRYGVTPRGPGRVLRELATGGYHRYSRGFESAGFDLLLRGRERLP